jgi:hypothetical protein
MKMAKYTAELPVEGLVRDDDLIHLQGMGGVRVLFFCEFESRSKAIKELTAEYEWMGYDADFWEKNLSGKRKGK